LIHRAGSSAVGTGISGSLASEGGNPDLWALISLLAGHSLETGPDWSRVLELARGHAVSPLLYWQIYKTGGGGGRAIDVPADVREELESDFYTTAARVELAERQLARVLRGLADAGVSSLVLKGAAVGAYYPDAALRPFGDLDLMVSQVQLSESEEVLNRLGYRCSRPKAWWSDHFLHLPPMVGEKGSLVVELHWRLHHEHTVGRLPTEDLWARAMPWSVAGQPALRLDPVDTALHLCYHAMVQHRARLGLRALYDLVQVTDRWGQDEWAVLVQRAAMYGLARTVYLMGVLVEQTLGLDMPAEVMAALQPAESPPLPEGLVGALLSLDASPAGRVPVAAVQAGAQGTFAAKLRHLLWHLFLPREGMAVVYDIPADSPRIWLTYLWRPLHLLQRYGRSTWGALRGERSAYTAWQRERWLERWLAGEDRSG
jgi:hypothetical protein